MQSRPRRVENKIAEELSAFFSENSLNPVERIPILGRTGPDLTINQSGLVLDVKSRQSCPQGVFNAVEETGKAKSKSLAIYQLDRLQETFLEQQGLYMTCRDSKMVLTWLCHMQEWTDENMPWGTSGLILHKPELPYGKSVLVLCQSDVGLVRDRILNRNDIIGWGQSFIRLLSLNMIAVNTGIKESAIFFKSEDLSTLHKWTGKRL